jgi:hypothetical protein
MKTMGPIPTRRHRRGAAGGGGACRLDASSAGRSSEGGTVPSACMAAHSSSAAAPVPVTKRRSRQSSSASAAVFVSPIRPSPSSTTMRPRRSMLSPRRPAVARAASSDWVVFAGVSFAGADCAAGAPVEPNSIAQSLLTHWTERSASSCAPNAREIIKFCPPSPPILEASGGGSRRKRAGRRMRQCARVRA